MFKSVYSWVFLILTIACLWLGVSALFEEDADILQLRDYLAWVLIVLGLVAGYHFIQITFRNEPKLK